MRKYPYNQSWVSGSYFDSNFTPGDKYVFQLSWGKYDVCDSLHGKYINNPKGVFEYDCVGYIPELGITEYGFSPRRTNDSGQRMAFAPLSPIETDEIDADEYTQTVYALRSFLIHSTLQANDGTGLTYNFYFHHPFDYYSPDVLSDVGYFGEISGVYPVQTHRRKISYITNRLLDTSVFPDIGIGQSGTTVFVKAQSKPFNPQNPELEWNAWCGWSKSNGEKWLAFWRYKRKTEYYKPNPATRSFVINHDLINGYSQLNYGRFNFSVSPPVFDQPSGISITRTNTGTNETTIGINGLTENDGLTENPIFLQFIPNP